LSPHEVRQINEWAVDGHWPELVLFLDAPSHILEQRMQGRQLDRFEQEGDEFHQRVRDGFHEMARSEPDRWVIIDASNDPEAVARAVRAAVQQRLGI
jgi:dTMP kinase